ncbi:MAG: DNA-protecting protein DprA [Bacteroidetes bacterium]|nr:DNA-protecting protein DprA [Bacteroidota bacterium]
MLLFPIVSPPAIDPADPAEQRALVTLARVPGVGPGRIRSLVAVLGSGQAVLAAPLRRLEAVEGVGRQTAEAIRKFEDDGTVEKQFDAAERAGAELITMHDPRFPALLKQIYDPPPFLWVRGRLAPEDNQAIAIVGTRKATDYGRRAAEHFAGELVGRGFTIISGLAYGIDIAAHRAAQDAGGRTIAVLGSGVDRIYPATHHEVIRRIINEDCGAVVSEFPMGASPDATNFPRRNRIIAGLSLGTLVVESRDSGGALITAFEAIEQNREVFAVPAPFHSEMTGTNHLIQKGHAALVMNVEDVLAELGGFTEAAAARAISTHAGPVTHPKPSDLNRAESKLYDALGSEPIHLDALCAETGLDAPSALVYLLSLEFKGLVRQLAGKQFFRA